ncbi:MAG: S9 family peptidase [Rikenellaceae bacterium]
MKRFLLSLLSVLVAFSASAQKMIDYSDFENGTFATKSVHGVRSMEDGEHYTTQSDNKVIKYSYETGDKVATLFDGNSCEPKIQFKGYQLSPDEKKMLLTTDVKPIYRHSYTATHWIYDTETQKLTPLSKDGNEQVATISPDGKKAAFVRDNNLFWVDLSTGEEHQFTTDGKYNHILNGIPDWVYEEEYSFAQAYEWSPESDCIAFFKSDESRVNVFKMNTFIGGLYPKVYEFKHPKAGEDNSIVSIHTYNLESKKTTTMDIGSETDQYIPRVKWSSEANKLIIFRLNRLQNNFDMLLYDASTGSSKLVYNEVNSRYIERIGDNTVTFLADGNRFIIMSERDGFMHLYLCDIAKQTLQPITTGNWEVTDILGVDEKKGVVYYISTEKSPLERNLYSIKLNGKSKELLAADKGTYSIAPSKGFKYFISYFSNSTTPNLVRMHSGSGKIIRVLEDNSALKEKIKEYGVPKKEYFTFKTSEGVELNGYMIKPYGFDESKKYPVLMTQYSGPGSQSVANKFGISWEYSLLKEGYIIACVDGRGTGFRGEEFKKCTYLNLGHYEVIDQIEGGKYIGTLPYVDSERIGIYGWSYGGFMALNVILKGNDVFKASIAVAPVTSWRYYDTIYTEIYNGLPQDNPKGYDDNSPVNFAHMLKGNLLIAHGTGDDNVHVQNTYEMIEALSNAGKPFEMAIYPDKNHGMGSSRNHLMRKCIDFLKRSL